VLPSVRTLVCLRLHPDAHPRPAHSNPLQSDAQVGDIEKRQTAEKEREERKAAKDAEVAAAERVKNAEARHNTCHTIRHETAPEQRETNKRHRAAKRI